MICGGTESCKLTSRCRPKKQANKQKRGIEEVRIIITYFPKFLLNINTGNCQRAMLFQAKRNAAIVFAEFIIRLLIVARLFSRHTIANSIFMNVYINIRPNTQV